MAFPSQSSADRNASKLVRNKDTTPMTMQAVRAEPTNETISFGPFSLAASERLLTRNGAPVELSARAYDILATLISRPNEVISKYDLLALVWPDVTVEEGSLRFHVAGLRKALGDGKDGARYITTASGRGYCFVAPLSRSNAAASAPVRADPVASFPHANLPTRLTRMVGRDEDVLKLSARLNATRLVTVVGPGGVGKTTVGVAVGHHLLNAFNGAVLFVDFGMLSDPKLVPTVVASMLGLSVQSEDAGGLTAYLREKRVLLILDTCEHLIDAVAALATQIFRAAPQVHILSTSREALQLDDEYVYRLDPLACPPEDLGPTAAAVQEFPATRLFVERAAASGARLDFTDAEAAIVVGICRKLDGVALAIELAARRVETYGLAQTAALLDKRLTLLWLGPRGAPARQKTLQATHDWSYGLLSDLERTVLRRLAVFVGHFTLDAALAVATSAALDNELVLGAIDSLVAKSMVVTRPVGAMMRYRLLDTTRDYALGISAGDSELADLAIRHACYYQQWAQQAEGEWSTLSTGTERIPHFAGLNNVRSALEWCFGTSGDVQVGVRLAAAAVPVFLSMSLFPECQRWSQRAVLALDATTRGSLDEMHLQVGLGLSTSQIHGDGEAVDEALNRSLVIAEQRGDTADRAGLLNMVHYFYARRGDFKTSLQYARRCRALADTSDDPALKAVAHAMFGRALQVTGDISGSRDDLDALMRILSESHRGSVLLGFDPHYRSGIALARTLWLQGYPAQAMKRAREAVAGSQAMGHPAALALVLAGAATVCLWCGDLDSAQSCTDQSFAHAEANAMGPLMAVGQARKAELAMLRGNARDGVVDMQAALARIHAARLETLSTEFHMALAQGLAAIGRVAEAMTFNDETIRQVERSGETFYMPELLRVKAGLLLSLPQPNAVEAERCLVQSLEVAQNQGSRGWELRTAIGLASLLADRGQRERASSLLQDVFGQFDEGFVTADLKAAQALLTKLA
jgi:predicted ATPase/DNA-binding winged helix-turn-helix (wHTH) protein